MRDPAATARKLLALARDARARAPRDRTAAAEAEAFAHRAGEIARLYRLSEVDVGTAEDEEVRRSLGTYAERHYFLEVLATAVAKYTDARAGWVGPELFVFGTPPSADRAAGLYGRLLLLATTSCAREVRRLRPRTPPPPPPRDPFADFLGVANAAYGRRVRGLLTAASIVFDPIFDPVPTTAQETFGAAFAKLYCANFAEAVSRRLRGVPPPAPTPAAPPAVPPGAADLQASIAKDVSVLSAEEQAALPLAIHLGAALAGSVRIDPSPRMLPESLAYLRALAEEIGRRGRVLAERFDRIEERLDEIEGKIRQLWEIIS